MARTRAGPQPTCGQTLRPVTTQCPACQRFLWADYDNFRTVTTQDSVLRLTLHIPDGGSGVSAGTRTNTCTNLSNCDFS